MSAHCVSKRRVYAKKKVSGSKEKKFERVNIKNLLTSDRRIVAARIFNAAHASVRERERAAWCLFLRGRFFFFVFWKGTVKKNFNK